MPPITSGRTVLSTAGPHETDGFLAGVDVHPGSGVSQRGAGAPAAAPQRACVGSSRTVLESLSGTGTG